MADLLTGLIDSRAAARLLRISYENFRARVSRGLIPEEAEVRIGSALLFKGEALMAYARQHMNQTEPGWAPNPMPNWTTPDLSRSGKRGRSVLKSKDPLPAHTQIDHYESTRLQFGKRPFLKDASDVYVRAEAERVELQTRPLSSITVRNGKVVRLSSEEIEARTRKYETKLLGYRDELRRRADKE